MDILELRGEIDRIDRQLVALFAQRMAVAGEIADYKKAHSLAVFDPVREEEKLAQIAQLAGPALAEDARELYTTLFALSRRHQNRRNGAL